MVYDTYKSIMSSSFGEENHIKINSRFPPKRELQGPRPPALKVIKDSSCTKITNKKPTAVIASIEYNSSPRQVTGTRGSNDRQRRPVVIHLKSPKIIHTRPQDFMILVQQLTGKQQSSSSSIPLLVSSSSATGSSCDHKCGSSSSVSTDTRVVDDEDNNKEIAKQGMRKGDDDQYLLQLSSSSYGGHVSSLRTSNIFSPASLFGTTGFMTSPNACTNSANWHDFSPLLR